MVSVDLSRVPQATGPAGAPPKIIVAPSASPQDLSVQGVAPTSRRAGVAASDVSEVIAEIEQRRKQTADRITEVAEQSAQNQSSALEQSLIADRNRRYYEWLDEAAARTRVPFDRIAPKIGALRLELSNIVPFPATQPRTPPRDEIAEREQARAAEIVRQITTLEQEYRREVDAIYSAVEQRLRTQKLEDTSTVVAFRARLREAQARAQRALGASMPVIGSLGKTAQAPGPLPAAPGKSARTSTTPSPSISLPGSKPKIPAQTILQQDLAMFLSLKGYVLAKPGETARDATSEFIQWRSQNNLGPSGN